MAKPHISGTRPHSAAAATADNRARWGIAFLLGFGVLINFFDRVNLSVAHDALRSTFHMDEIAFGYLAGAYNWTYAACQLPIGALLDAVGVAVVGRIGSFVWGVATLLAAISPTFGTLFASRMLLGIGEAPIFPANAKAIGLWFPPEERGLPTAIFDAAAKFSTAIGVPIIGILLLHVGWRWAFAATAFASLAYFGLFYFIYRDPPPAERHGDAAGGQHPPVPFLYLLRQRKVYGLFIGYGAYNYVFYLLLTWLPTYLAVTLHIDLMHSFLYTGVPWLIATATDLIAGGWLVDALMRRGFSSTLVRQTILIAGMLLGMGLLGAVHSTTAGTALFWISVSIGGLAAAAPVSWSLPALVAPPGAVGRVGGMMNLASQISAIAAPVITGYLYGHTHSFAIAFSVPVIYLLAGIAGYIFLLGRIEPIPTPVQP
jgi:ACS family D-galactonate transporter-like MFS transporter